MKFRRTKYKIHDPDTLRLKRRLPGFSNPFIRLSNVHGPEKFEPGAQKAKRQLSKLLNNGKCPISINVEARDKFNRALVTLKCNRRNVNKAMRNLGY